MPNFHHLDITLVFAAIFGILHVLMTLRVGRFRMSSKISMGDGGNKQLLKVMRGHGNFVENVPIGLLLLLLNELNGASANVLWALGGTLLFGRLAHYSQFALGAPFVFRPIGMLCTLGSILVMAIWLLL